MVNRKLRCKRKGLQNRDKARWGKGGSKNSIIGATGLNLSKKEHERVGTKGNVAET